MGEYKSKKEMQQILKQLTNPKEVLDSPEII